MSAAASMDATMRTLARRYRGAKAESAKEDPFRSLVFTMLSARTRDDQTEIAYRKVIGRWPTAAALAAATPAQVVPLVRTIGLYRGKAKNLVALAKRLVTDHGGKVPADIDAMVALPGVGRKTANCVMVYAFGVPAVCVDTHVHRIANRLGWVKTTTPERTERALRAALPRRWWLSVNHLLIRFGREICVPWTPKCWRCPVRDRCAYAKKTPAPKK